MAIVRTKTGPFDWALIQWARACEPDENGGELEPRADVATTVAEDDEYGEDGRLTDPLAFLTRRAEGMLEARGVEPRKWLHRAKKVWLFSMACAIVLGAVVFPFSRVDTILDDGVNLAGPFVFFLLGQIFFLFASLVWALLAVLQGTARAIFGRERPVGKLEKYVRTFSSLMGGAVLAAIRRVVPLYFRFFGGHSGERFAWRSHRSGADPAEAPDATAYAEERARKLERSCGLKFWDAFFSRPRFLFFWGGSLSHAFWLSCSLCVLIILVARMQGNRYDYCWRTSLEDERVVKKFVDVLGAPVEWLGVEIPTKVEVDHLFEDPRRHPSGKEIARGPVARTRARWSFFLLSLVFVWCVAPRAVLLALYGIFTGVALRDFRPDLKEPYYQDLIMRAELRGATLNKTEEPERSDDAEPEPMEAPAEPIWPGAKSEPEQAPEPAEEPDQEPEPAPVPASEPEGTPTPEPEPEPEPETPPEPEPPTPEELLLESFSASAAGIPDDVLEAEPPEPPAPRITVAFGYDASFPEETWRDLLGDARETVVLGDLADLDVKKDALAWLEENGARIALCVFSTDVGLPPARHFVKFVRDVLLPKLDGARIVVVLSGGERLRLKFQTSPNAVSERIEDWTQSIRFMAKASGELIEGYFNYDADLDLPESRAALRGLLAEATLTDPGRPTETERDLARWEHATALIVQECRKIFESPDFFTSDEAERLRVASICDGIFKVYREEVAAACRTGRENASRALRGGDLTSRLQSTLSKGKSKAAAFAEKTVATAGAMKERLEERGLGKDFIEKRLVASVGLSDQMRRFCKKLSPKCALAAASVGVTAPVAVAFAPLLGGAVTATALASTLGALTSVLPASLSAGAVGGALGAIAPASFGAMKTRLLAKLRGGKTAIQGEDQVPETVADSEQAPAPEVAEVGTDDASRLASAAALTLACGTWCAALELQDQSADRIETELPRVLAPLEDSALDSVEEIAASLRATGALLQTIPRALYPGVQVQA